MQIFGRGSRRKPFRSVSFQVSDEFIYRPRLLRFSIIIGEKHFSHGPLCPVIIVRIASAHLPTPIKGEANAIELLSITCDIAFGCHGRMLACLNGILFCRQAVRIITHRIQDIEAFQALIAGINV